MRVLQAVAFITLFATAFAFDDVEEFEIDIDSVNDEVWPDEEDETELKNSFFELVSRIDPNAEKATKLTGFSYKDCGGPEAKVNINSLSITPDPVKFPGPLNVAASFKIISSLNSPLAGNVTLYKAILGKMVKLPCVGEVGSCTYDDLCMLLEQVQCPDSIVKIGIDCSCPLKANSYTLPKTEFDVEISIPTGTYRAIGNATMSGQPGVCLDITLTFD